MKHCIAYSRIVDCSHPVSEGMPLWPGDPATRFMPCADIAEHGFALRSFSMSEHGGTHCNAPNTFFPTGPDIAQVLRTPPVLPIAVADFSEHAARDARSLFLPEHLADWEARNGQVQPGTLFCVHTGWDALWEQPGQFLGITRGQAGAMCFPAVARETAELLMHGRGAAGVGIDTHGVDSPADDGYAVNRTVLAAGGLVLECLARLNTLPATGATAVIGGLRLEGGTGCPVSVTVFVP